MSMPRAKMRSMKGTYNVQLPKDVIMVHHKHEFHGSKCPVLTTPDSKCLVVTTPGLKTCCDPCPYHGPNCTVGICLGCWLYRYKKSITHFMPDLPYKKRFFKPREKKPLNTAVVPTPIVRNDTTGFTKRQVRESSRPEGSREASVLSMSGKVESYGSQLRSGKAGNRQQ